MELDSFLGGAREEQEASAAVRIQAVHRGRAARGRQRERSAAAVQIQAAYRGRAAREAAPPRAGRLARAGFDEGGAGSNARERRRGAPGAEGAAQRSPSRPKQQGAALASRPPPDVAAAGGDWIAGSGARVGWDEVQKATAVDPGKATANADLKSFFEECLKIAQHSAPAPGHGPAAEDSSDGESLAGWDGGAARPAAPQEVCGDELKELVSQLRGRSEEESRDLVKALPWHKAIALARLVMQARRAPKKKGWLAKRGPTTSYGWQPHWVVLSHCGIDYFADQAEKQKKGDIRFGPETRAVAFRSHEDMPQGGRHPFGFVLTKAAHPDVGGLPRLFYFEAESEEAMEEWTSTINAMGQP